MLQTYQGYFQNGRFISPELANVPENVEVYIMVTGKEFELPKTKAQQQLEAFDKFVAGIKTIDDEPLTDEDFSLLENNRVSFARELDL